jgi:hypothetical protein
VLIKLYTHRFVSIGFNAIFGRLIYYCFIVRFVWPCSVKAAVVEFKEASVNNYCNNSN